MAIDIGEESIEQWTSSGPAAKSLAPGALLIKAELRPPHHLPAVASQNQNNNNGSELSLSHGQLVGLPANGRPRPAAHSNSINRHALQEDFSVDDEQPEDLSISRTQSQPELRLTTSDENWNRSDLLHSTNATVNRSLSKMEQKQLQWERERLELQAMQTWGPPSMVGGGRGNSGGSGRGVGRRLQPVAAVSPQRAPTTTAGFSDNNNNNNHFSSNHRRVTNILNMENANHVQFTDRQSGWDVSGGGSMSSVNCDGGTSSSNGRFSVADEARKRLGHLGSDVADPALLRIERAQKAAEYRKAIEQQVEEKRQRKIEEELRAKREEEAAERKLQEERERLRKQYEEEQRKIRLKEEAEERTRQILLEKVKEAEAAAEEARRIRLRRNTMSTPTVGTTDPATMASGPEASAMARRRAEELTDEVIAASVQNILKLPSPPAPRLARGNSNLSSMAQSSPHPVAPRRHSGFLAASSNLPSASGGGRAFACNGAVLTEFVGTPTPSPATLQQLPPAAGQPESSSSILVATSSPSTAFVADSGPVDGRNATMGPPATIGNRPLLAQASSSSALPCSQAAVVFQAAPFPSGSIAIQQPTTIRHAICSTGFIDQAGADPYAGAQTHSLVHHQMPLVHTCQTYVESMPSPPRTGYSGCSGCSCACSANCHQLPRLPYLTSFSTQTPSGYFEDRVLTPTKYRLRQRSQSLKNLRNSAVQTDWTMLRNMSPPSSAPSSPVGGRPQRRRRGGGGGGGPTSTGVLERVAKNSGSASVERRPPWNAHTPHHAYVKNTDRDPNMHTRKKLQELRKQHWEREMSQQNARQRMNRRRIVEKDSSINSATGTSRTVISKKSVSRSQSRERPTSATNQAAGSDQYASETDLSVAANNDTATGSDFPDHQPSNGYATDRAIGKGLRDDGVDSSEVSATASATPGPNPTQQGHEASAEKTSHPPPAPAPRKTWKSQSMYIPQGRSDSPPVPAVLNKMRQLRQCSDDLNSTRNSVDRESTCADDNELEFLADTTLNMSQASHSTSVRAPAPPPSSAAIVLSSSHGSFTMNEFAAERECRAGTHHFESSGVSLESSREVNTSVNDQKKILSQLSALRQTLLMKRQELENTISTPRMTRKAKT